MIYLVKPKLTCKSRGVYKFLFRSPGKQPVVAGMHSQVVHHAQAHGRPLGQALRVLPSNGFRKVPNDEAAVQARSDLLHHRGHGVLLPGVPVPQAEPSQPTPLVCLHPRGRGLLERLSPRGRLEKDHTQPRPAGSQAGAPAFPGPRRQCSGFEARRPPCPGPRCVLPCGGESALGHHRRLQARFQEQQHELPACRDPGDLPGARHSFRHQVAEPEMEV